MNGRFGGDKAQICTQGLHFFHLDFNSLGQKEQKNNGIDWTSAMKAFPPFCSLEYQKVPHVSLSRQSFKGQMERENTIRYGRKAGEGRKEHKKGGGDGKRRKGEKVGQFVHVCEAQTVDNGTEVDGRTTALLMEQLKCGLTTRWLSHAMAPDNRHALETLK